MRFGLHLPQLGRSAGLDHIVRTARRAEELGFDDVWVADHVAVPTRLAGMPSFFPEPVPLLSAAAAHTSRVGLGTSVLVPAYRNPMQFAKQWATLDWLSGGRTILGVGAGWLAEEFEACGVPMRQRGRRLDDYIGGWRAAWGGAEEYTSDHFSFRDVRVKPAPAGPVPIWIGGSSPGALRRAARCEGWMGTWAPLEVFADRLAELRAHEQDAAGGSPTVASIHMEVRFGSPLDGGGRWSEVGDGYGERPVATGTVPQLAELLAGYVDAGLQHVLLVPLARSEDEWAAHVDAAVELKSMLGSGDRPGAPEDRR
ncbi:MAG: LLM class flavin-dependent oxidoreductase [Acidimicrobiia bacterium]|nr:LLM class flavin-dependent oxidoreductase [Acidimicrobiia bacterium]MYC46170.1 LLM class flavin-dependent oxidoreductase [Acidimicrobiia bacterium]MYI18683.1 LLM class flavin-dependent oxidoreductase [Acidimicrobiia bacterium]